METSTGIIRGLGRVAFVMGGLFLFGAAPVHAQKNQIAFERAARLKHGVNFGTWYAGAHGDYSAARLASFITPDDFRLVKSLGLDHVRLQINPEPLIKEKQSGTLRPDAMARLEKSVHEITALGLVVVLDIQPDRDWKKDVVTTNDGATRLLNFWRNFALSFADTDPALVYFEVLNEPSTTDLFRWAGEQAKAISVIRSEAPRHTIIATGANWSRLDALIATEPVNDDNIIYTFHMYDPFEFTHQSADWMPANLTVLHGVPYPSSPEAVAALAASAPDEDTRTELIRYGLLRWDASHIAAEVALGDHWANTRHVPLWCGEFGVHKVAPRADRVAWTHDTRVGLEAAHVGWAMYDYQTNFSMVNKQNGVATPDPEIVQALGLGQKK